MREHEVPTHVQAEDKVLLGFTFPQIVAVVAVCAISYGAYRYAPVGPSEVRMALAVVLGLVGVAMVVGKIGGRRLPLVAADRLKYRLGARVYSGPRVPAGEERAARAGTAGQERPRPSEPHGETRRARAGKAAQEQEDPQERGAPQRAYALVRQAQGEGRREPPRPGPPGRDAGDEESEARRGLLPVVAVILLAAVVTVPQAVLADGHWQDEIDFELTEPVEGRRIFVEGLTVSETGPP